MSEEINNFKYIIKDINEKLNNNIKYFETGKCTLEQLNEYIHSTMNSNLKKFEDAVELMNRKHGTLKYVYGEENIIQESGLDKDFKPQYSSSRLDELLFGMTSNQRAQWWLTNGQHSKSSKTMFQFLSGKDIGLNRDYSHPIDPDDFIKCYFLIKTVPEWKPLLNRLSVISPVWKKIVDNWDRLTTMYEQPNSALQQNNMYSLMKSLGC